MFKKLLGVFALAGLLGAMSSCTENDLYNASSGDLVEVTFTVTSEGVLATRAENFGGNVDYPETKKDEYPQISDGSKAKRLIWAVYDKKGNLLPELGNGYTDDFTNAATKTKDGQVVQDIDHFPHTIRIRLVRGQEYSFAFWAQDENCTAFDTQDLRKVKIDYKGSGNNLANDELRDAFCKVETFTVTSAPSMERTIILRRPFAQVNVGIPQSEYEALRQSGVRIIKSKIHMENVATQFDVVANSTHGENPELRQAIDYEYNFIPAYYNYNIAETGEGVYTGVPTDKDLTEGRKGDRPQTQDLKIDLNHDGTIEAYGDQYKSDDPDVEGRDETYNYMLMAYILPADRNDGTSTYSTTLDKVEFSLLPEKAGQSELTFSLENVPVQRNWRTNIFGSMFTSDVVLRIDLDPFYAGDYNYPEWERIYEGVTYNAMDGAIHISNGAGLVWLSNATNGVWKTEEDFVKDNTHNQGANLTNSAKLMLKAAKLEEWPQYGLFRFKDVTIKLDADIDLNVYASLFADKPEEYYFTPIGFGGDAEVNGNLNGESHKYFGGHFDGQNHTIYNLKTVRPEDGNDNRSMGLFSTIGREASIKNLRLKNIDIRGHYRTGGIVGSIYGPLPGEKQVVIDNCYVDGGTIINTSNSSGGNGKDSGGIIGIIYNNTTVSNCNVRNLTIRGYRTIGGIVGQTGGDYTENIQILNNKVYNCTLIADWFQYYATNRADYEIENIFIGERYTGHDTLDGNEEGGNKIYAFWWKTAADGTKTTEIGRIDLLSNPPLDIFPRLVTYTNIVHLQTSILGGPSAWKEYYNDNDKWQGTPNENSGRVGMYISGITLDGDTDSDPTTLDNATITASGVEEDNACVLFVKDEATIKNLTVHGATYAGQGICLSPASGKTITLTNVLSYDAKQVLTDESNGNGGNLVATDCNFRGYVKLSDGYKAVAFTNTIFDGSTKRVDETINKLESASKVTLEKCTFIAPFDIYVPSGATLNGCTVQYIKDGVTVTETITDGTITSKSFKNSDSNPIKRK